MTHIWNCLLTKYFLMKSLLTRTLASSNSKITGTGVDILPKANIKQDKIYESTSFGHCTFISTEKQSLREEKLTNVASSGPVIDWGSGSWNPSKARRAHWTKETDQGLEQLNGWKLWGRGQEKRNLCEGSSQMSLWGSFLSHWLRARLPMQRIRYVRLIKERLNQRRDKNRNAGGQMRWGDVKVPSQPE